MKNLRHRSALITAVALGILASGSSNAQSIWGTFNPVPNQSIWGTILALFS